MASQKLNVDIPILQGIKGEKGDKGDPGEVNYSIVDSMIEESLDENMSSLTNMEIEALLT